MYMKYLPIFYIALTIFLTNTVGGQIVVEKLLKTSPKEYEKWVAPYRLQSAEDRISSTESRPKLIITQVSERIPSANDKDTFFIGNNKFTSGWVISNDGEGRWFSRGSLSVKGSCCSKIEKTQLEQIDRLLANLPDDHSQIPPNGRRVVFQIPENDKFKVRVYDLANAPDEILELLRLTKTGFRSKVLWFDPESEWLGADESDTYGGLAVTSDKRQIIFSELHGPIKIWNAENHNLIGEFDKPQEVPFNGLVISPNNSTAAINGWGTIGIIDLKKRQTIREISEPFIGNKRHQLSNPQFIENGKYLLIESAEPSLHIYDTATWNRLNSLPEIPSDAVSFHPSPSNKLAVYQSKDGKIYLRNVKQSRNIAALGEFKIKYAAFSADESMIAVVTSHPGIGDVWYRDRLRVWNTKSGKFIREFLPFERDFCESIEGLKWSPDDKYILAANKADIFFTSRGISIWNVESGRHRGELQGCPTYSHGFGFIAANTKIVLGCGDGKIRIYDFEKALDEIRKFEK